MIDTLRDRGLILISHSHETGIIEAKRKRTFFKPELNVKIKIRFLAELSTEVIVNAVQQRHWLKMSPSKISHFEKTIIGTLDGRL